MVFEYASGRIELFELSPDNDGFGGYAMCERHAETMTAPVGWTLTDWRPPTMTLFPLSSIEPGRAPALEPVPDSDVA
jgi:hypothetical protein